MTKVSASPVDVPARDIDDLRERLGRVRLDESRGPEGWALGPHAAFLRSFCAHWADFDWRALETRINGLNPVMVETDAGSVHCLHVQSPHAGAVPLLITHGWPGSIVEMLDLIGPLTDPPSFGGTADDAFHVVVPSLPGYGFSPKPAPGMSIRKVGSLLAEVMVSLGYDEFVAQGGDWGAIATSYMGIDQADRLLGIHLNTVLAYPPTEGDPTEGLNEAELANLAAFGAFAETGMAYVAAHGTRPDALSPGLLDSPVGLAAWILDKFWAWSDNDGSLPGPFSMDALVANVSVYWFTGTIGSSIRLYTESLAADEMGPLPSKVPVPTGCALFPREILVPARRWADDAYNVTHWSEFETGGHFAALERPDELVEDIRTFARSVR